MTVSIIIPALNEAGVIECTLDAVRSQPGPKEIIVVDGGSSDDTPQRAAPHAAVVEAPRGRAHQMNRGAEIASGDVLWFLHADTLPPPHALTRIRQTIRRPDVESGIFQLSFDRDALLLRLYSWCTRWPWIRIAFGDRGLFATREAFEAVGGFPDWPIFEDLELADRLHQRGTFRFLPQAVTTSARRFRSDGLLRQQLQNLYLWTHYVMDTDPERVAHLYAYDEK
ncbi:MAG: glycosyltransferase [Bacteroidetes bacterium]|jgi:rSAM/selenodomain-associated transferase 2|nr:glycosyltransferase [Bacteroidota bacterium]